MASTDTEFRHWMLRVNNSVVIRTGLDVEDLADMPYRDWFDDGLTPAQAARLALQSEGF